MVPRRAAQPRVAAVALPLPAGGVPLRATWSPRTAGAARTSPSTSCWTPGSSTTTGTGSSRSIHAKADPHDLLMEIRVTNAGPEAATLHVLPHLWFRNTWAWDVDAPTPDAADRRRRRRSRRRTRGSAQLELGRSTPARTGSPAELLFCDNETNAPACSARRTVTGVPQGRDQRPRRRRRADGEPERRGHQGRGVVPADRGPGETAGGAASGCARRSTQAARSARRSTRCSTRAAREADEFYAELIPAGCDRRRAAAWLRQAFAGMIWGKQFYHYDVERWLDGDPTQPPPPPERRGGRNAGWRHLDACDILSMPDPWEYPWFAAWDLAFHSVALAHVDPAFAKYQLLAAVPRVVPAPERGAPRLRVGVRRRQPAGARVGRAAGVRHRRPPRPRLPRPAAAQAAAELHLVGQPERPGGRPTCSRAASSAWTTSAPIDRSNLPAGGRLEQADGTGWMAFYA